ncbi:MAG: MBL fold metallo-hydrolase [Candidatus Magasanikbacteria bacterium]|nr:MBL fold metallo-hydrolase [Candidatus Magasanikbacteria bacterium]
MVVKVLAELFRKYRKVIGLLLISLVFIAAGGLFYYRWSKAWNQTFAVHFFDIGQGDAALIRFGNGAKMLVDCGPDRKILSKLGATLPWLDRTIDYLVATHPDLDHYGGCVDVLRRYQVKRIIVNGRQKSYDPYWREWDNAVKAEGAAVIVMASPTVWQIADNTLEFISPDPTLKLAVKEDDNNNYSIVFRLARHGQSFLFTGDAEVPLEQALIAKYCAAGCPALRSDVLKVGHHGSGSSTSAEWLAAVRPRQAVISAGKQNRYGHPSRRVLRRLERSGIVVLRTDTSGDITIK